MYKKDEMILRNEFKKGFNNAFEDGLLRGTKAICQVVLDKANDTKKTPEERMEEIRKFCNVSLGKKE